MMFLTRRLQASALSTRGLMATSRAANFASDNTGKDEGAAKQEWGIQYEDEIYKFQKEWKEIADAVAFENPTFIKNDLSDL